MKIRVSIAHDAQTLQKIVKQRKQEFKTVNLSISGGSNQVDRLLALLGMLEYNGEVGHSGTFGIGWDGDGQDQVVIESQDYEAIKKRMSKGYNACSSYGGSVEYMGELGSFFVGEFKKDLNGVPSTKLVWKEGEKNED